MHVDVDLIILMKWDCHFACWQIWNGLTGYLLYEYHSKVYILKTLKTANWNLKSRFCIANIIVIYSSFLYLVKSTQGQKCKNKVRQGHIEHDGVLTVSYCMYIMKLLK